MQRDPVLAHKILPADPEHGQKYPHTFRVEGGLHYIRGNSSPHFSLTYTEHRKGFPNQDYSGGAGHDTILQHFPQFADLAALHLSDINGVPMHAEANGWYNLAGALGGFGEQYHTGNSKRNFPLPVDKIDPAAPWQTTEHRLPTCEECLQSFARHCRVTIEEARSVAGFVQSTAKTYSRAYARAKFALWIIQQHPRWKQEADACIARHGLTLYGDPWQNGAADFIIAGILERGTPEPGEAIPRTCHDLLPGDSFSESAPASPAESTYIEAWKITSTATQTDRNPNLDNPGEDMTHWRVTLKRGRAKMTVYFSMGSAHTGRVPTAREVIDCIAPDAGSVDNSRSFEEWAADLGYNPDSRATHRTYTICKRQGERLQKFLGADHYAELMGAA